MVHFDSDPEIGTTPPHGESVNVSEHFNPNDVQSSSFWSLRGLRVRWADPVFRKMVWNVFLLSCSWSLGQGIFFIQISITTLAATSFANSHLVTIPIGVMLFIATIFSVFLPRAIARVGYRTSFYFGALMGMTGAGLCIVAAWYKLYWLLIVGSGFLGGQVPCTLYYRLAALQFSTQEFAPKAIAIVLAGSCLSCILGPELAKHTVNALSKRYSGAYLTTLCECVMLLFTMTLIQFPRVEQSHDPHISNSLSTITTNNSRIKGRSIFAIARQRVFLIAAFGGFVSWSAMAIQMSAAPLAMTGNGYSFVQVISVVECHILGMFLPSILTGALCHRFGSRLVMLAGLLIQLIGVLLFQRGFKSYYFYSGLTFVGIGWNFGYVGSSTLLTESYRQEEKSKTHSLYEPIIMLSISIAFFSSAFAEQFLGWMILTGRLISIYLTVAVLILGGDTIQEYCKTKDKTFDET